MWSRILLFAVLAAPPALAQGALPADVVAQLRHAVAMANPYYYESAVTAALARYPQLAPAIAAEARRQAPGWSVRVDAALFAARFSSGHGAPVPRAPAAAAPRPAEKAARKTARKTGDKPWGGKLELGGSQASGNTETKVLSAALSLSTTRRRWSTEVAADFEFVRDDGRTTAQRLVADAQARYRFNQRAFLFGYVQYEDDRFNGFDYRLTENGGLGYRLFERAGGTLHLEGGPGLRQSRIKLTGKTEFEIVGRVKAGLVWPLSETATVTVESAAVAGEERTTLDATAAITMPIVERLSGTLSFNARHSTSVPAGTNKTDTLTKASISYSF